MCITRQCPDPTEVGVHWREDDCWKKYNEAVSGQIRLAKDAKSKCFKLGKLRSNVHPAGDEYEIDFSKMEQVNLRSGYRREVRIVGVTSKEEEATLALLSITDLWIQQNFDSAIEQTLHMMIKQEFLEKTMKRKHGDIKAIRANPYLGQAQPAYTNFLKALQSSATKNKRIAMELWSTIKLGDVDELKSLEFVFHGTPRENVSSILKQGLSPSYCKDHKFWLRAKPSVSLGYCKGSSTMLLLLQLKGNGETPWSSDICSVPNSAPHLLLPVAEVDVVNHNHGHAGQVAAHVNHDSDDDYDYID